jgi:2-polyprenyl-6-methoxyphenol hydroxylase-like FAD-dependent oxidoreductase
VRQHFQIAPWSPFVDVHCGPGLEAYVTPCGPRTVGVAILWEPKRLGPLSGGDRLFFSLLNAIPHLRERLTQAQPIGSARSTGPFEQRTTRRAADGIVLLGDASGYLDPCTGEGLTLAFRQALALETCVVTALEQQADGVLTRAALQPYEADWRRMTRPYFLCTRFMLFCQRSPTKFHRFIRFIGDRPDLLRHFLSYNMGTAPLFPGFRRARRWLRPFHPQTTFS